ncbi:hypothetical protein GGQ88_003904 [Novosphingobium hassiacum]|jgi:hypothetical protein|uniref:Uncharacterized protein n=1 Tax=Novosphingobium hassiacum TaxID=173676 RepID=A0A7W6A175_9SPHN|nr:hypothetical protein [Novosphingobium hassiacum]MBB3862602.1 hypothetical protein [Novosphingobium hassiacum]MBK6492163.1 hypothetical protein [Sphingomonadales bacterium]MBK6718422.1 hypothetical protein [Sphingomonadales bacterium]
MSRKPYRSSQFTHEDDYRISFPPKLIDVYMCLTLKDISVRYLLDATAHGDAARLSITANAQGFRTDDGSIMSIGWCDIDLITDWHIQHDFEEGDWKPWEAFRNLPQGYIGLLDPLHSPNRGAMDDVTSIGAIVLSDRAIDRITTHTRAQPEAEIKITGQLSEADLVAVTNINLSH